MVDEPTEIETERPRPDATPVVGIARVGTRTKDLAKRLVPGEIAVIDHVDLEWCLRARAAGYRVVVDTAAHLEHSLGDDTVRLPGRPQPVHVHGPIRCYYLARNTIFMIRSGLLPVAWRAGYVVWLAKFIAFHSILADRRRARIRELAAGIRDGLARRGGPRT